MTRVAALDIKMVDPAEIDKKIRRATMRKIANVVRKYVRREAPKRTGKLRKSLATKVWDGGMQAAVLTKAPHAHLLLDGTDAHWITVRKSRIVTTGPNTGTRTLAKHSLAIKGHPIGPRVWVSGVSSNDFFTRGAENARHEVYETIKDVL